MKKNSWPKNRTQKHLASHHFIKLGWNFESDFRVSHSVKFTWHRIFVCVWLSSSMCVICSVQNTERKRWTQHIRNSKWLGNELQLDSYLKSNWIEPPTSLFPVKQTYLLLMRIYLSQCYEWNVSFWKILDRDWLEKWCFKCMMITHVVTTAFLLFQLETRRQLFQIVPWRSSCANM